MSEQAYTAVRTGIGVSFLAASYLVSIALSEDYRDTAYIPVKGDVPTIGYGSTKGVKMGQKTTPARALARLNEEVQGVYVDGLKKCITAPLYPYELGAYVSLAYSVGVPAFCSKAKPGQRPKLLDLINAGKYAEACERISEFKYGPNKVIIPGLIKRRAAERTMCEGF